MAGDLNIALILRLIDQVSKPAEKVVGAVQKVGMASEGYGRRGVEWADRQTEALQARRSALAGEAAGVAATGFALFQAIQPAIEFESAMAGVSKVVEFETPAQLLKLQEDILALTSSGGLPMTAEGIAAIIEAAGQAGIVDAALPDDEQRAQLIAFARDAAQMGVAFDMSAEQSGAAMSKWMSAMKLTREEALELGDAVNHLSNNMDATAPDLVEIIRRQGAVAMTAGLSETEVAALSASFLAGGAGPEVAATGMKNFLNALTKGEALTKRQDEVMDALGLDPVELAKRMQTDAQAAILDVLDRIDQLPEHQKGSLSGILFGEESKGAIMPLLSNLDLLRNAFGLISDESVYAGSMLEEYQKQAGTTAAAVRISRNFMRQFAIIIGAAVLPELNELMRSVGPVAMMFTDWAQENPEWVASALKLAGGLLALKAASIGLRFAAYTTAIPLLGLFRALSYVPIAGGRSIQMLLRLASAATLIVRPVALARAALVGLRVALLASGLGAAIAGIALGGMWVYNNWSGLLEFFDAFGEAFVGALGPAAPMLENLVEWTSAWWEWLSQLFGPVEANGETWRAWGETVGDAVGGAVEWVTRLVRGQGQMGTVAAQAFGGLLLFRFGLSGAMRVARLFLGPLGGVIGIFGRLIGLPVLKLAGKLSLAGMSAIGGTLASVLSDFTDFRRRGAAEFTKLGDASDREARRIQANKRKMGAGAAATTLRFLTKALPYVTAIAAPTALGNGEARPEDEAFFARPKDQQQVVIDQEAARTELEALAEGWHTPLDVEVPLNVTFENGGDPRAVVEAMRQVAEETTLRQLPTADYTDDLRRDIAEHRAHISELRQEIADLEATGGPTVAALVAPKQQLLNALIGRVSQLEEELLRADAAVDVIQAGLTALGLIEAHPTINRTSIEAFNEEAQRAVRLVNSLNSGAAPATPSSSRSDANAPGRDRGGAVRAGFAYRINERFEELFVPGMSGTVLPGSVLQAAEAAPAHIAKAAAAMALAATPSLSSATGAEPTSVDRVMRMAQSILVSSEAGPTEPNPQAGLALAATSSLAGHGHAGPVAIDRILRIAQGISASSMAARVGEGSPPELQKGLVERLHPSEVSNQSLLVDTSDTTLATTSVTEEKSPAGPQQGSVHHWHIHPSAGMDEVKLAQHIAREMDRRERKKGAALHDGVDY
ncbi:phage tail tape measure protein [Pseudaestuariivita sp.]|uniref:phage tail tape measure protein n=1 Tax=Pseudaestuariivita sp. TaxID=2211669 RepID=UPI004058C80E